jgi:threonine dehydrogenase-like Zn-dependent dehydrogenase
MMKTLVIENRSHGLALRRVEMPGVVQFDDVLYYCAICVGEQRVVVWEAWAQEDPTLQIPTVLGLEASGTVVEVGKDVQNFKPGDHIVFDPFIFCKRCRQ